MGFEGTEKDLRSHLNLGRGPGGKDGWKWGDIHISVKDKCETETWKPPPAFDTNKQHRCCRQMDGRCPGDVTGGNRSTQIRCASFAVKVPD